MLTAKRALISILAALAAPLSGCSIEGLAADVGLAPERPEPGKALRIAPIGAWTEAELDELGNACADWRSFSEGLLSCELVGPNASPDAWLAREPTGIEGSFASLDMRGRIGRIDVEGLAAQRHTLRSGLGALARNMFGLASGLSSHKGPGVLGAYPLPSFTDDDRNACRAAGFCR